MELKRTMYAYADGSLKMPAHYVDMSEKEMEYDGGWSFSWKKALAIVVIAAVVVAPVALAAIAITTTSTALACAAVAGYGAYCANAHTIARGAAGIAWTLWS